MSQYFLVMCQWGFFSPAAFLSDDQFSQGNALTQYWLAPNYTWSTSVSILYGLNWCPTYLLDKFCLQDFWGKCLHVITLLWKWLAPLQHKGSPPPEALEFDGFSSLGSHCGCLFAFQAIHDNPGEWLQQNSVRQRRETSSHGKSQKSKEGSKDPNGRMAWQTSGKHVDQTGCYWRDGTVQSDGLPPIPTYSSL